MIFILKAIAVLLGLVSIIKAYIDFRKKREPLVMFLFWLVLWVVAITILIYPTLIDRVASIDTTLTIGSLTAMGFVFLLYIVYRVYTKAARIEYQQTQLIRKMGLAKEFPHMANKKDADNS